jgi:beta-N-acetylhexosaminidase
VHAMADALTTARGARPEGAREPAQLVDDLTVASAFDVSPAATAWRDRAAGRFDVVRLEDRPNMAIGVVPWGPDLAGRREVVLGPDDPVDPDLLGVPLLVLGRDVHRHPSARAAVDRLRQTHDVLVVDLGWPSPDRAYADVATFGASRRVGAALQAWLERTTPAARTLEN